MSADGAEIDSPITAAVDLSALTRSGNPQDRHFGEILNAIAEVNGQVVSLRQQIGARGMPGNSLVSGLSNPIINSSDFMKQIELGRTAAIPSPNVVGPPEFYGPPSSKVNIPPSETKGPLQSAEPNTDKK